MGSITHIIRDTDKWEILRDGLRLRENGEELLKVRIGEFDDDLQGIFPIEQYIRKSIYESLVNKRYTLKPGKLLKLDILDESGNSVKPYFEDGSMIY